MGGITVVQGFTPDLRRHADCTQRRAYEMGYEYRGFELGLDDDLKKTNGFIPCHFKPDIIFQTLAETENIVVYLDVDVALVKPLEIEDLDFKVGAARRPLDEIAVNLDRPEVGTVNTGILFFRPAGLGFVGAWRQSCFQFPEKPEQEMYNRLIHELDCIDVTLFDQSIYHAYVPSPEARLVHFKPGGFEKIHQYCKGACEP